MSVNTPVTAGPAKPPAATPASAPALSVQALAPATASHPQEVIAYDPAAKVNGVFEGMTGESLAPGSAGDFTAASSEPVCGASIARSNDVTSQQLSKTANSISVPASSSGSANTLATRGSTSGSPIAHQLTRTLKAANGPPMRPLDANQVTGSISGQVFQDLNGNGVKEPDEAALVGWVVYLDLDNSATIKSADPRAVTAADGTYTINFQNLAAGTYAVRLVVQPNWAATIPANASKSATLSTSAPSVSKVNFGAKPALTGSIQGTVWNDLNHDGVQNSGEPGLAGVTMYLDLNKNGRLDAGEPTTVTDSNGLYSFNNLPLGVYVVAEVGQTGWEQTAVPAQAPVYLQVGPNVNVSQLVGNQQETAVAVDPNDPTKLFVLASTDLASGGLFAAYSMDAGRHWASADTDKLIADAGSNELPTAAADPGIAWDKFGNLFISYLESNGKVAVAVSVDDGQNFTLLTELGTQASKPSIATGPGGNAAGSVWVAFEDSGSGSAIVAYGAPVPGWDTFSPFLAGALVPNSSGGNFADIAVGLAGQVLLSYESPATGNGPAAIYASLDANGLAAGGFSTPVQVATTKVGGTYLIPAQPDRGINASAHLAFDSSSGPYRGRAYLVYTDASASQSSDTDIYLTWSGDNGMTWNAPVRVNDVTTGSQFLPRVEVDQSTGAVGIAWYDARAGATSVKVYATVGVDGGISFLNSVPVSTGASDQSKAEPAGGTIDYDFGDYISLAFSNSTLYPVWADDSNLAGTQNPDGKMDIYTAGLNVIGRASSNVNVTHLAGGQAETAIAVNPTNPLNIIIAANDSTNINNGLADDIWATFDGGATWTLEPIPVPTGAVISSGLGDPSVVFDRAGQAVYIHMVERGDNHQNAIGSALSLDGGLTWNQTDARLLTAASATSVDKDYLAVGPNVSYSPGVPGHLDPDRFVATWGQNGVIYASTSVNGKDWSAPLVVHARQVGPPPNYVVESAIDAIPAVGPNGYIYIVWEDSYISPLTQILVSRSTDGGQSWDPAILVATSHIHTADTIPAQDSRGLIAGVSIDVDRSSGPHRGQIYVAFTDTNQVNNVSQTHDTDIFIVSSDDFGLTWTAPRRVNNDVGTNSQFFSWLAVDQSTGAVAIGWYDARADSATSNQQVYYFVTVSRDGGSTFVSNFQASLGLSNSSLTEALSSFDFGDYTGLAFLNGVLYPAWADNSNSTGDNPDQQNAMDVYTTALSAASLAPGAFPARTVVLNATHQTQNSVNFGNHQVSTTNDFANLTVDKVLGWIANFMDGIGGLADSLLGGVLVPFTDPSLSDAVNRLQGFVQQFYYPLVNFAVVAGQRSPGYTLAHDAEFTLQVGSEAPVTVVVSAASTTANTSLQDLVNEFNAALPTALANEVQAGVQTLTDANNQTFQTFYLALRSSVLATTTSLVLTAPDTLTSDATQDNAMVKQLGFSNSETALPVSRFATVQQLLAYLGATVGAAGGGLHYDSLTKQFTLQVAWRSNFNTTFSLQFGTALGSLGNIQLDGKVGLDAALGLNFTLGVDLNAQDVPSIHSSPVVPVPANGQLSGDARFTIVLNGDTANAIPITLAAALTASDTSVDDLATKLNAVFADPGTPKWHGTSLSDLLVAQRVGTGLQIAVKSSQLGIINQLQLSSLRTDPFATELGFGMTLSADGNSFISTANAPVKGLFIDNAKLSASLLGTTSTPISGSLQLGFVGISTSGGTVGTYALDGSPNPITTSVALQDKTSGATRFYLKDFLSEIGNKTLTPATFTGSFLAQLNNIDVNGLGFSVPLVNPQISLWIPDITHLDYNANPYDPYSTTGDNQGVFVTYPSLGDLQSLSSMSFTQIIQALQTLVTNLSQLSATSFLGQKLPLIDMSPAEIINYAAQFGDLVNKLANGADGSLQQFLADLSNQIDAVLHLGPDVLNLSLDDGGLWGITAMTDGAVNGKLPTTAILNPEGMDNAISLTSNTQNLAKSEDLDNTAFRLVDDPNITDASALVVWDKTRRALTVRIHSGVTTANTVITAITLAEQADPVNFPWLASIANVNDDANTQSNSGLGTITTSSMVTRAGINNSTSTPATTTIRPGGDNNDFTLTSTGMNGGSLNGSVVFIVGDSDLTGDTAQAVWDANDKILTLEINAGQTTAATIVKAITDANKNNSTAFPWTAAATTSDNGKPTNDLSGKVTTVALKLELKYSTSSANSVPFNLNLKQLVDSLGLNDPVRNFLDAATNLLVLQGSGNLQVSASASATLDFGLDLTNLNSIRPFIYNTTGIELKAKVLGTGLNFEASLGSVAGIFIENGTVTLDQDGNPNTGASSGDTGADFTLQLKDTNGTGRHYFDKASWLDPTTGKISLNNIDVSFKGGLSAILPIFAPLQGTPLGGTALTDEGLPANDLVIDIPDLQRLFMQIAGSVSETAITTQRQANSGVATIRIPGPNNDFQITETGGTSADAAFQVVLMNDKPAGSEAMDYANHVLTIHIASGSTTLQTVLDLFGTGGFVSGSVKFTATALAGDPKGTNTTNGKLTTAKVAIRSPDFSKMFDNLDFCTLLTSETGPLLDGLDTLLGKIQDGLNQIVLNTRLPMVGDGLATAANFIQSFREGLLNELRHDLAGQSVLTAVENAIKEAFWNSLGPGGLNLLVDPTTGAALDASQGYSQLAVTLDCNTGLTVNLRLKKDIKLVDTSAHPINFDIGVPGFGLQATGNVQVSVGFDMMFGFGVNPSDGFYFNSSSTTPELHIYFLVTIPGVHLTGQLAFLQLNIADNTAAPSRFLGQFNVFLTSPDEGDKLTWAEMRSSGTNLSDVLHGELAADAAVNLDLVASFGGDAAFPSVHADFHLTWHFDATNGAGTPVIWFDNVSLDFGSFISNFLRPLLDQVHKITEPIQPILDMVTARIPILSDIAGQDVTMLTLAQAFGYLSQSTVDFIQEVAQVVRLINDIEQMGSGEILIPFGGFSLTYDSSGQLDQISNPVSSVPADVQAALDQVSSDNPVYKSQVHGFAGDLNSMKNFSLPFWQHPTQLFNLFIGKPVSLVEWRMPTFSFKFTYAQDFPLYPPLFVKFGGTISADINLGFGYDTYGIQEYFSDPNRKKADFLDGFYIITTDTNGQSQPALSLTGQIFAGADLNLGLVSGGVVGGISATIGFYWNDNSDNDGKMRFKEIAANAADGIACIFDMKGSVSVFLHAFVDVTFPHIHKEWDLGDITILNFTLTCPQPVLGDQTGGILTLNIGSRAGQRLVGDTSDDSENFIVRHISGSPDDSGGEAVDVTFSNHVQHFTGVHEIDVLDPGQGDNVLDFRGVKSPVHVAGGAGNDTIYLSDGKGSVVYGGSGNDTVIASPSASATGVAIYGGRGNDTITAGAAPITIYGGAGNNVIQGSSGNDVLFGGGGNDVIHGGGGDDFIAAGPGQDTIYTGDGHNFILGDSWLFVIGDFQDPKGLVSLLSSNNAIWNQFSSSARTLLTTSGATWSQLEATLAVELNKLLQGPSLASALFPSGLPTALKTLAAQNPQGQNLVRFNRLLLAAAYSTHISDRLPGGGDVIYGGSSDNIIDGGMGNDVIYGGEHNDLLIAGFGRSQMFGEGGNDVLIGAEISSIGDGTNIYPITFANVSNLNGVLDKMIVPANPTSNPPGITIQGINGGAGDLLVGGGGSDVIFGGAGADTIYGGNFIPAGQTIPTQPDGNNFIDGGPGDDVIFADDAMGSPSTNPGGISIQSSIWLDTNNDGIREPGEGGFAGVTVTLYQVSNPSPIATQTTDVNGNFQFVGLEANNYTLSFSLPTGLQFTKQSTAPVSQADNDSDVNASGQTGIFNLSYNQTFTAVSAGYKGPPMVSIGDASLVEGNSGRSPMVFPVTLSGPQTAPVWVQYQTIDGSASATAGDYMATGTQTLVFNPGETSKTITVWINGSTTYGPATTAFKLQINQAQLMTNPTVLLTPSPGFATGTIVNPNPPPSISIHPFDPGDSSLVSAGDFFDPAALIQALATQSNTVSHYLWGKLSPNAQSLLRGTGTLQAKLLVLEGELDTLIQGPSLYDPAGFAGVTLSYETVHLLAQNPHGQDLVRLNRVLLEDAYPSYLPGMANDISVPGAGDVLDLSGLIQLFQVYAGSKSNALSLYLWDQFSPSQQGTLTSTLSTLQDKQLALLAGLNAILQNGSLYDATRFAGITLSTNTQYWLTHNPQGPDVILLNRLLLSDAYPQEFAAPAASGSLFSASDLLNQAALTQILDSSPSAQMADYLWGGFTSGQRTTLTSSGSSQQDKLTALLAGLSLVLQRGSVYDATRLAGVTLSADTSYLLTQILLNQNPQSLDVLLLNRLLLADVFPSQIAAPTPSQGAPNSSPIYSTGDFFNAWALIQQLVSHTDSVSQYIWGQFGLSSSGWQGILSDPASTPQQKLTALAAGLNAVLAGPSIHDAIGFGGTSVESAYWLTQNPHGQSLVHLNRLLLDEAYPQQLAGIAGTEGMPATFLVTLSNPSKSQVTVNWQTDLALDGLGGLEGSAALPAPMAYANFISGQGTLTFQPGVTSQVITVQTLQNNLDQFNMHFYVDLSNPVSAIIDQGHGFGLIRNNDPPVSVFISPIGGQFQASFSTNSTTPVPVRLTVALSGISGKDITVTYGTSLGTALETVDSNSPNLPDYFAAAGTLVFKAFDATPQTITIWITPHPQIQMPDRIFYVNLLGAANATIAANTAGGMQNNHFTVIIHDPNTTGAGDTGPWSVGFSASNYDVTEPASGATTVDITLVRTPGSSEAEVIFSTSDGTATAGVDYAPVFRQLVSFADGELTKTISIPIYHDLTFNGDETVMLSLRNPVGAPLGTPSSTAMVTIHEVNTVFLRVVAMPPSVPEENGSVTFRFELVDAQGNAVTAGRAVPFTYQTVDLTAHAHVDYTGLGPVTDSVPQGQTYKEITVTLLTDEPGLELPESFLMLINSVNIQGVGLKPHDSAALATILDDDKAPITGRVFYDANGNGYRDSTNEPGIPGVSVDVTYDNNGTPVTTTVTTDGFGYYTLLDVPVGTVSILVHATSVKSPFGLSGSGATYSTTTNNESQTIHFQGGSAGLLDFADVGYHILSTTSIDPKTSKDAGTGATNSTVFGGPGNDQITVGGGNDHVVGGSWMTATDGNAPVNKGFYDAVVTVTTTLLPTLNGNGPIWGVNTDGLKPYGSIDGYVYLGDASHPFTAQQVTVDLYDCNGNQVNTTLTDGNGHYVFNTLYLSKDGSDSDYVIQFELPAGFALLTSSPANKTVVGSRTGSLTVNKNSPSQSGISAVLQPSVLSPVPGAGGFQFGDSSYTVSEAVQNRLLTVTIERGNSFTAMPVMLRSENDTASAGTNYDAVSVLLYFAVGETVKTVDITILNSGNIGNDCATPLTFNLVLRDPVGTPLSQATVYIGGQGYGALTDDDTIHLGGGADIVLGDSGNIKPYAVMTSNPAPVAPVDIDYFGGPGKDTIYAGTGADYINGQLGKDVIYTNLGNGTLIDGGGGFDRLISAQDVPLVTLTSGSDPTSGTIVYTGSGNIPFGTTTFTNIELVELLGGPQANTFNLTGYNGAAFVEGGGGTDTLQVQNDTNMVLGDASAQDSALFQSLYGFPKDASLSLANGATVDLSGITNVILSGGPGDNILDASGYSRAVTFIVTAGHDTLIGGSGNDTFVFALTPTPLQGLTLITGNGGADTLDFSASTVNLSVDLSVVAPVAQTPDPISNPNFKFELMDLIENATGGSGNDTLHGNALDNVITAGSGTDTLTGGGGNDVLVAGAGNDTLNGGPGNDRFVLRPFSVSSAVIVKGNGGSDTLDFSAFTVAINVNLSSGSQTIVPGGLQLSLPNLDVDNVIGGAAGGTLTGNNHDDAFTLIGGVNHIYGGGGSNMVLATADTDFALSDSSLTIGGAIGGVVSTLQNIRTAVLTGGPSANTFDLTGFTGTATIDGGGIGPNPADDTVKVGANGNFTLADSTPGVALLTITGNLGPFTLKGIGKVELTDTGSTTHTLDASLFSGEVTLNAGSGGDTLKGGSGLNFLNGGAGADMIYGGPGNNIVDGNPANSGNVTDTYTKSSDAAQFVLQNNRLVVYLSSGVEYTDTLRHIQNVALQGTASGAIGFDVRGWTAGTVTLQGGSGDNTVVAQAAAAGVVYLSNAAITFSGSKVNLYAIQRVTLIGSTGDDTFDVTGWTAGDATILGGGGSDTVQAQATPGATITLKDDTIILGGSNGTITLSSFRKAILNGSTGGDTLNAALFTGTVTFHSGGGPGTETLTGGSGDDQFVFPAFTVSQTVNVYGGGGTNTLDFSAFGNPITITSDSNNAIVMVSSTKPGLTFTLTVPNKDIQHILPPPVIVPVYPGGNLSLASFALGGTAFTVQDSATGSSGTNLALMPAANFGTAVPLWSAAVAMQALPHFTPLGGSGEAGSDWLGSSGFTVRNLSREGNPLLIGSPARALVQQGFRDDFLYDLSGMNLRSGTETEEGLNADERSSSDFIFPGSVLSFNQEMFL